MRPYCEIHKCFFESIGGFGWMCRQCHEEPAPVQPSAPAPDLEQKYRHELWRNHCHDGRYGDDGEMQCSQCPADFKRDSLESLEKKVFEARAKAASVPSAPAGSARREEIEKQLRSKYQFLKWESDKDGRQIIWQALIDAALEAAPLRSEIERLRGERDTAYETLRQAMLLSESVRDAAVKEAVESAEASVKELRECLIDIWPYIHVDVDADSDDREKFNIALERARAALAK
jgi:hypothetical protein